MMPERASRTFICSVLFLDIVEYSRMPVAEQIQLKDRFNGMIASAIRDIPAADRIILDTGDGVAINFLADPEDALFVAMSLRDVFGSDQATKPDVPARIGINLGPVRMVKDLNGRPNIIGDGINVAQRIMGFGKIGQILVSRSYYEIVSHISEGYTQLFTYEGSRTDKHVREHEIYSVGFSRPDTGLTSPADRARMAMHERQRQTATASAANENIAPRLGQSLGPWLAQWWNNRTLAYGTATFSSCAFLLSLLTSFLATPPTEYRPPSEANVTKPSPNHAVKQIATASGNGAAQPNTRKAGSPVVASDAPAPIGIETEVENEPVKKKRRLSFFRRRLAPEPDVSETTEEPAETALAALEHTTDQGAETPRKPQSNGSAKVVLAIAPWGEVYVDGNHVGVSPPVNEIDVSPGAHTIEIRNGDFPPHSQKVDLEDRQSIKIRYKFN